MKQFYQSLFLFIIILTNLNGQWKILNNGKSYRIIDFVNSQVMWGVEDESYAGWPYGSEVLLKTEDGGRTWDALSDTNNFRYLDFVDESTGWATYSDWNRFYIKKSIDGGLSWDTQYEDVSYSAKALFAVNDSVVYTMGDYQIVKTTNGGKNWFKIDLNFPDSFFNSIRFYDTEVGVITGFQNADDDRKSFILKTINGGIYWEEIILSDFNNINSFQFINDSIGYFVAEDNTEYYFCRTIDFGNSFTVMTQSSYPIHSFFILDNKTIFTIMDDSVSTHIMKSTDGGSTWQRIQSMWNVNTIKMLNSDVGFISGDRTLYRTVDGGNSWIMQNFSYPLYDIYFVDQNLGFACGGYCVGVHGCIPSGDFFVSFDGGQTWTHRENTGWLKSCQFLSDELGFAIRENKSLLKTSDQGYTWSSYEIKTPEDSSLGAFIANDVHFVNEWSGWVIGSWFHLENDSSDMGILKTMDGGETWGIDWKLRNAANYFFALNSIHVFNTNAWAVGESGIIVKYTPQNHWKQITGVTDLPLRKVFFSDEDHGWISGGYNNEGNAKLILLKTEDGGENWRKIQGINYEIDDMFFVDSLHGWAVGSDTSNISEEQQGKGVLLATSNGGENWSAQVEDLRIPLSAIYFKDGNGWAVGLNGLVLRTDDGATWIDKNTGKTYSTTFRLKQNYPNPFNPSTNIKFTLSKTDRVRIDIYNTIGQKVKTILNKRMKAGQYEIEFDARNLASGLYYYRIEAGDFHDVKKMVLLK